MPARPGATAGYIIAYAVTLASFIVIWFSHPVLLYIGRDANLSLWLSKAYLDWAYPLDVTAMNPFQGMTSMLMAINPYFNPGSWIFVVLRPALLNPSSPFLSFRDEAEKSFLRLLPKLVSYPTVFTIDLGSIAFARGSCRATSFKMALSEASDTVSDGSRRSAKTL